MDIGFERDSKEEFLEIFGKQHLWFWKIMETVRKAKLKYDINITDILVKKNVILLGVLKNFFDIFDKISGEEVAISEDLIRNFVDLYCKKAKIKRRRSSIDFSINCYGYGIFRINYSESAGSPVLNIRVLDFEIPKLEKLRCPAHYMSFLKNDLLEKRSFCLGSWKGNDINVSFYRIKRGGLILHAGETGSGKTTFIASELQFLADRIDGLIVTYEKPIEYRFIGPYSLRVIQYDLDVHLSEEDVYYHFLRSSPHVGFFYEIKDREEFVKVVDLASRGHLIFSTVHAGNVYEVFSSFGFFDSKIKQMFFSSLRAIVCHKLILDEKRNVIPFYEIFINTDGAEPVMNLFMKNEFLKLKTFLYKERGYNGFYPFSDSLKAFKKFKGV